MMSLQGALSMDDRVSVLNDSFLGSNPADNLFAVSTSVHLASETKQMKVEGPNGANLSEYSKHTYALLFFRDRGLESLFLDTHARLQKNDIYKGYALLFVAMVLFFASYFCFQYFQGQVCTFESNYGLCVQQFSEGVANGDFSTPTNIIKNMFYITLIQMLIFAPIDFNQFIQCKFN